MRFSLDVGGPLKARRVHWDELTMTNDFAAPVSIVLQDGIAAHMGDGYFMVMQEDATVQRDRLQRVLIGQGDLSRLQASTALTETLEDGRADHVGDRMWMLTQRDEAADLSQNVVITAQDIGALLAAV